MVAIRRKGHNQPTSMCWLFLPKGGLEGVDRRGCEVIRIRGDRIRGVKVRRFSLPTLPSTVRPTDISLVLFILSSQSVLISFCFLTDSALPNLKLYPNLG